MRSKVGINSAGGNLSEGLLTNYQALRWTYRRGGAHGKGLIRDHPQRENLSGEVKHSRVPSHPSTNSKEAALNRSSGNLSSGREKKHEFYLPKDVHSCFKKKRKRDLKKEGEKNFRGPVTGRSSPKRRVSFGLSFLKGFRGHARILKKGRKDRRS